MQLTIDSRERGLISIFRGAGVPHQVETLPVGDVLCQYDSGHVWIAERKRADDFAASLQDGRWREQSCRLFASGHQVVFIFEGDLRETGEMYQKLIGAWLSCELRRCYVFRTLDVQETALVLRRLVVKLEHPWAPVATGGLATPCLSKRKRHEDKDTVLVRVIMCVPSISESIARRLAEHFGSLPALQDALRNTATFPRIQLTQKTTLGKARIAKLAEYLA